MLLNDTCRCFDTDCPEKNDCQRWVYRNSPDGTTGSFVHAMSLYPYAVPPSGERVPCPEKIPFTFEEQPE